MPANVYVDFDGTIAPDDPMDALFERFADPHWRRLEEDLERGRLTARECTKQQVALLRASPEDIDRFLEGVEIDPQFPDFVDLCRQWSCRVIVVSDGLDRVVGNVLRAANLSLPFFANRLQWRGRDRWKAEFPFFRADCRGGTGNCKCSHPSKSAGISLQITVGDGRSDFCVAERSDLVLAKGRLAAHCRRQNLPHIPIKDFAEATDLMADWLYERARVRPLQREVGTAVAG